MTFPELIGLTIERIEAPNRQQLLAGKIGVTQGTISRWQRAEQKPVEAIWRLIAEACNVPVEEIEAAIKRTRWIKPESLSYRLAQCEERLKVLEQENSRLRSELEAAR